MNTHSHSEAAHDIAHHMTVDTHHHSVESSADVAEAVAEEGIDAETLAGVGAGVAAGAGGMLALWQTYKAGEKAVALGKMTKTVRL